MDTARYGHIVGFFTIKDVKKGEQFLSNYYGAIPEDNPEGYSIPKWYMESWIDFKNKHPDKAASLLLQSHPADRNAI